MKSVLQDWVMELPLRFQGTLLTAVRGCDDEAKTWTSRGVAYSPGRRLTAFIRYCFMNPADIREVDAEEGALFYVRSSYSIEGIKLWTFAPTLVFSCYALTGDYRLLPS